MNLSCVSYEAGADKEKPMWRSLCFFFFTSRVRLLLLYVCLFSIISMKRIVFTNCTKVNTALFSAPNYTHVKCLVCSWDMWATDRQTDRCSKNLLIQMLYSFWCWGVRCYHLAFNVPHRLWSYLYGHLHWTVVTAHPQNLSFIDFTKCTMTESSEKKEKPGKALIRW